MSEENHCFFIIIIFLFFNIYFMMNLSSGFSFAMLHVHMFSSLITVLSIIGLFIWALRNLKAEAMKKFFVTALIVGALVSILTAGSGMRAFHDMMGVSGKYKLDKNGSMNQTFIPPMMDGNR